MSDSVQEVVANVIFEACAYVDTIERIRRPLKCMHVLGRQERMGPHIALFEYLHEHLGSSFGCLHLVLWRFPDAYLHIRFCDVFHGKDRTS